MNGYNLGYYDGTMAQQNIERQHRYAGARQLLRTHSILLVIGIIAVILVSGHPFWTNVATGVIAASTYALGNAWMSLRANRPY